MLGMYRFDRVAIDAAGTDATHATIVQWNRLQGSLSTLKAFRGDNANAVAAQLIEVTGGVDLSAATFRVEARGA